MIEEWRNKCELVYLFANKTVLEMYPKFGFIRVTEYEYFKAINKKIGSKNAEKLNMEIQSNRDMLYEYAKNSAAFGQISMVGNIDLIMFYCISLLKEHVYYINQLDIIAVATFNTNKLSLWGIFSKNEIELDKIIDSLIDFQIDEIVLGFSPQDRSSYKVREISGDDALFVQNGKTMLFENNKLMFPLLSHA